MSRLPLIGSWFAKSWLGLAIILGLSSFFLLSSVWTGVVDQAWAQSSIEHQSTVTATVDDNGPPTTPILIAPCNNCYVTNSMPYLVWTESTDPNGIDRYRLTVDGLTHYDNIPTTDTDNSQYTLTYNSSTTYYTLSPKTGFSDGTHTWKIGVFDNTGNFTESATWSFIVDTQAPSFVLTAIGDQAVSISAQDSGTLPTSPVELGANEPLLTANGEANSTVLVTLIIPGDPSQNYSTTIGSGGTWSLQLGLLPRDVVMTLNFVITDVAGNLSVLNGVEFIIPSDVIVFPPASPTPTPSPVGSAEPTPTPSPGATSQPEASPTTTEPAPSPIVSIKVVPPQEFINEVFQESLERIPGLSQLTQSLSPAVQQILEAPKALAPISAVVVAVAVPTISTLALAAQFGGQLSPELLAKIMQTLALIPSGEPQGLVFDSKTHQPVPFALLTISSIDPDKSISETVVSDVDGIYKGIQLPPGNYHLTVTHQEYSFPTTQKRPSYLQMQDFYKGEVFQVTSGKAKQLFLIPVDLMAGHKRRSLIARFRIFLTRWNRRTSYFIGPVFVITILITLRFPTVWNWGMSGVYLALVSRKIKNWLRAPSMTGLIIDHQGIPIADAIVRLRLEEHDELTQLVTTDKNGRFKLFVPAGKYQLAVNKQGYIWYDNQPILSFYEVEITNKQTTSQVITMQPVQNVYQDLFE